MAFGDSSFIVLLAGMSQGRSQQTDALNDFDAALAIDHFTDHGRVIEAVR